MKCFVFFAISLVLVASAPLDNQAQVSVLLCYTVGVSKTIHYIRSSVILPNQNRFHEGLL